MGLRFSFASGLALTIFAMAPEAVFAQCSKDTDCKGNRICDSGVCTSITDGLKAAGQQQQPDEPKSDVAPSPAAATGHRTPVGRKTTAEEPPQPSPLEDGASVAGATQQSDGPGASEAQDAPIQRRPSEKPTVPALRGSQVSEYARSALFLSLGEALIRNGQPLDIGFFGSGLKDVVRVSPEALAAADDYSSWRMAWFASDLIGWAFEIVGAIMTFSTAGSQNPDVGLIVGGDAVMLVGIGFFFLAHLFDTNGAKAIVRAVNHHNATLLRAGGAGGVSLGVGLFD